MKDAIDMNYVSIKLLKESDALEIGSSVVTEMSGMGGGRKAQERGDICIHIAVHFFVPWKLTQHC